MCFSALPIARRGVGGGAAAKVVCHSCYSLYHRDSLYLSSFLTLWMGIVGIEHFVLICPVAAMIIFHDISGDSSMKALVLELCSQLTHAFMRFHH